MTAIIISIGAGVVSGAALLLIQRYFNKKDIKDDERDKAKAKESILVIKILKAVGNLTVANSIALKRGESNGETEAALEEYESVDKEMYDYLLEQNSRL